MWKRSNTTVTKRVTTATAGVHLHFRAIPMKTTVHKTNMENITMKD